MEVFNVNKNKCLCIYIYIYIYIKNYGCVAYNTLVWKIYDCQGAIVHCESYDFLSVLAQQVMVESFLAWHPMCTDDRAIAQGGIFNLQGSKSANVTLRFDRWRCRISVQKIKAYLNKPNQMIGPGPRPKSNICAQALKNPNTKPPPIKPRFNNSRPKVMFEFYT